MAKREITQTNSYGDLLTWWHSSKVEASYDADEDRGEGTEECATCGQAIEAGAPYWRCTDTGDEIHEDCDLPRW